MVIQSNWLHTIDITSAHVLSLFKIKFSSFENFQFVNIEFKIIEIHRSNEKEKVSNEMLDEKSNKKEINQKQTTQSTRHFPFFL